MMCVYKKYRQSLIYNIHLHIFLLASKLPHHISVLSERNQEQTMASSFIKTENIPPPQGLSSALPKYLWNLWESKRPDPQKNVPARNSRPY